MRTLKAPLLCILAAAVLGLATRLDADNGCNASDIFWNDLAGRVDADPAPPNNDQHCPDTFWCSGPSKQTVTYSTDPLTPCDPKTQVCEIRGHIKFLFRGNIQNQEISAGAPTPYIFWYAGSSAPNCDPTSFPGCFDGAIAECGVAGFTGKILGDYADTFIKLGSYSCNTISSLNVTYSLNAFTCVSNSSCRHRLGTTVAFSGPAALPNLGCPVPRSDAPTEPGDNSDPSGGGGSGAGGGGWPPGGPGRGGSPPDPGCPGGVGGGFGFGDDGAPPAGDPPLGGPGAHLRYAAGGAGGPGFPGTAATSSSPSWNVTLGRYWSHDYAERIVMSPDETHVWLITKYGTFHEFGALGAADGSGDRIYGWAAPSSEYRTLVYNTNTQSWQLKGLDGSIEYFLTRVGPSGWQRTGFFDKLTDRLYDPLNPTAHPPIQASYSGTTSSQLVGIAFPDGRSETFSYHLSGPMTGKLAQITENPVTGSGTTPRSWTYLWTGDDLTTIGRPDGSSWNYTYSGTLAGYIVQVMLKDSQNTGRIEAAFEYDANGNLFRAWKGDPSFTGPSTVNATELTYDSIFPSVTTKKRLINRPNPSNLTLDVWQTTTVELSRDPGRLTGPATQKARITKVTGDCPTCGGGPNSQFAYEDPNNPLKVTKVTDAKNNVTTYSYDASTGRLLKRIETVQTSPSLVQRQTSWTYNTTFKAFAETVTGPFSPPVDPPPASARKTTFVYDAKGNVTSRTASGAEATYTGGTFNLSTTLTGHNAAGNPATINPPGFTTTDQTTFTYAVSGRNGMLPDTRVDPLVGTSQFGYDGFNRRTTVTDPNNVTTETAYDALNRVTSVTQQGGGTTPDLVTQYSYSCPPATPSCTGIDDLRCVQLPRGNAIEYGYDSAGRVTAVRKKANCTPATQADEQTLYTLDAVGHRIQEQQQRWNGTAWATDATTSYTYSTVCHLDKMTAADGAVTEYAYDCNNNLEKVWDANHPSSGQTANPSQLYAYDPLNRLTTVTTGPGTVLAAATGYLYDLQDHLSQVTDAESNVTTYTTGDRDLMTQQVSPVSGTTTYAYNDHAQLTSQTDARQVITNRAVDVADRVTQVSYPADASLTTTHAYGDQQVPIPAFGRGRLVGTTKGGSTVGYSYDRFGRMLLDGDLTYAYDANGNKTEIRYPGNVAACYGYDSEDRQSALSYSTSGGSTPCASGTLPIVNSPTTYLAAGPLKTLNLANSVVETHDFNQRYFPTLITAVKSPTTLLSWTYGYTGDSVGNIKTITALNPANNRTFGYQDFQYFLTQGDGPWGLRSWTYDKIGDRLTEVKSGVTDTYSYPSNGIGRNPKLSSIALGAGGSKLFSYDAAGNVGQEASDAAVLDLSYDAAGKLTRLGDETQRSSSANLYDGRGYLQRATGNVMDCGPVFTSATYSSAGVLLHRAQFSLLQPTGTALKETRIFYFAGRPVAQLDGPPASGALTYLTTDHLGTPILATDGAAGITWSGGFEPFGKDFTSPSAQQQGVFLRFPGQWEDATWSQTAGTGLHYNVHRWLEIVVGRYLSKDAIPPQKAYSDNPYTYALANPLRYFDKTGLYSVDTSCDRCNDTGVTSSRPGLLSEFIRRETDLWCRIGLANVPDLALRLCLLRSCDVGTVKCDGDCKPGFYGHSWGPFGDVGDFFRRGGALPIVRTAVVCTTHPGNFNGEAGNTVIHEWTHGCGYDSDSGVPGIPQ